MLATDAEWSGILRMSYQSTSALSLIVRRNKVLKTKNQTTKTTTTKDLDLYCAVIFKGNYNQRRPKLPHTLLSCFIFPGVPFTIP